MKLLHLEMKIINEHEDKVIGNAERLYDICQNEPNHFQKRFCLDYMLLEQKCMQYEMQKAEMRYPSEYMNQQLISRYLLIQNKCLYEYDSKLYEIDADHASLPLTELDSLYGESFFDSEYISYAQYLYRHIDEIQQVIEDTDHVPLYTKQELTYLNVDQGYEEKEIEELEIEELEIEV